jgi:hypothetical protein
MCNNCHGLTREEYVTALLQSGADKDQTVTINGQIKTGKK